MPEDLVTGFHAALAAGGLCYVQTDPPYNSPTGSHLGRFAAAPWAHLRMNEPTLEPSIMAAPEGIVPAEEIAEQFRSMPVDECKRFVFRHYRELKRIAADELLDRFLHNGFDLAWEKRRRTGGLTLHDLPGRDDRALLETCEIFAPF